MLFLSDFKNNNRIKSIQRGISLIPGGSSFSNTTISAVNTNKTELRLLGHTPTSSVNDQFPVTIYLLNSTTVQANRGYTTALTNVSWELTEWE